MPESTVTLLDTRGQWTHRDRHLHHEFPIEVPAGTVELGVRLWWSPLDMGDEHLRNSLALTLWGPDGFRGSAVRRGDANDLTIGLSAASPGALAGPIPPGRWVLNLDTGLILPDGAKLGYLEWTLEAHARVADAASASAPPTRRPESSAKPTDAGAPISGGPGWLRGDLHSHTVHSDGRFTVDERLRRAVERGLDFTAITDHNTISHHRELDPWRDRIVPIRGSEVTTFHGHLNVFGLTAEIDWRPERRGGGAAGIVEQAHRQGALVSINHPSSFGDPWCVGCHWDFARVDYSTFDTMEIWNGGWADVETANEDNIAFWTDLLDAGLRLTAISGTDSHGPVDDDDPTLGFNHVYAAERSEAAILEGIRLGRVYLSAGPLLTFRAHGDDGSEVSVPGETMAAGAAIELNVEVGGLDRAATVWFVSSGLAIPLGGGGPGRLRAAATGLVATRWWRLELRAGSARNGDILAITNPVNVGHA
ncbi:MAG TPA: CehA/McbA family metallohydrolase [Candidatus Limnocylindrales bacterium]|nr:CehA/McbA family metallohydrolase [Candidatus Limnocylindrales bacterium]